MSQGARSPIRHTTDTGSTLPLLLGGLALLLAFALTLVGSAQFLQQQRQLNAKTDELALHLAQLAETLAATGNSAAPNLEASARSDLLKLYGETTPLNLEVTTPSAQSVQVGYCEVSRVTIGAVIWGGNAKVCAVSRAEVRRRFAN